MNKKLTYLGAFGALALCGQTSQCFNSAQAQSIVATACIVDSTALTTPGLKLNSAQLQSLQAGQAYCVATNNGANGATAAQVAGILSAAAIAQPLLASVNIKALAPDDARQLVRARIAGNELRRIAVRYGYLKPGA